MRKKSNELGVERRREAISCHMANRLSLRRTAELLREEGFEVSHMTVARDVKTIIERFRAEQLANMEAPYLLDLLTTERLLRYLMSRVENGDSRCASVVVRVLERRAAMLGYDGLIHQMKAALPSKDEPSPLERVRNLVKLFKELATDAKDSGSISESVSGT